MRGGFRLFFWGEKLEQLNTLVHMLFIIAGLLHNPISQEMHALTLVLNLTNTFTYLSTVSAKFGK